MTPRQRAAGRLIFLWWPASVLLAFFVGFFWQAAEMALTVSKICGAG